MTYWHTFVQMRLNSDGEKFVMLTGTSPTESMSTATNASHWAVVPPTPATTRPIGGPGPAAHDGKRQRRTWTPRRTTFIPARTDTDVAVKAEIRRRGDFASGSYIGDPLDGRMQDNTIRVASTNFNKQTSPKLHEEIANWILANAMDVLFVADTDWGARAGSQVWKA
ncbi:hypothetical protein DYB25_013538 [Aphanomyces astaci]|uniref:Uncharacterized protein n=1 Tax=Aphanomyces astaci TaxID=112090 RepID=A0A396ZXB2_APHAT|nr:hypothetical protein DYB25_013538 [Aphanomyces astaci]